jgi:hypothetical protein
MRLGCAGANEEEICETGNATEIDRDDVLGLFVGNDGRAEAGEGFRVDGDGPGKGGGRL